MKKVSAFLLALALLLSITACTSKPPAQPVAGEPGSTAAATQPAFEPKAQAFADGTTVSIVQSDAEKAEEITDSEIERMVHEAVEGSGGLEGVVSNGQTVVLKPNLVQIRVDSTQELLSQTVNGVTTDWRVTNAVANMVREVNPDGKIYVMECSATGRTKDNMEYLHYTVASMPAVDAFFAFEEDSGDWQDFNSPKVVKVTLENGLLHKEYYFNKLFYDADVIISVPCLKTSSGVVVTAALKNVSLGAPPGNIYGISAERPGSRMNMVSHKIVDGELDKWIYDYYMCKPINFVVVDGLQGFQSGPVPMSGERKETDKMNMGLIIAGRDAVAVDTACALITGWDPESIGYLNHFRTNGVGRATIPEILVAGENVADIRKNFTIKVPALGGKPVEPKTPPALEVTECSAANGVLSIAAAYGEDAVKAEVYIDGKFYALRAGKDKMERMEIDAAEIEGRRMVRVVAYDRFLNYAAKEMEVEF